MIFRFIFVKKKMQKNEIALAAVCLAALMFSLEISSVPVILPTLEKKMHSGLKDMQWVMNAYTIACTTVLMATGTLADRYGRKRIFVIGIAGFGIASLVCGVAENVMVLIISRFIQGMAGGAMLICQTAILSHQFQEGKKRSQAFGIWGIVIGVGLGFGAIIGGGIVFLTGWQWVFWVHVPLAVLTLMLVFRSIRESRDPRAGKLDIWGVVTLSSCIFGLAYFFTQGQELGFGSAAAIGIITVSAVCFLIFLWVEKASAYPMFDLSVFRIRDFSGALMGCIGMNFSFWPFMIYLPIYFQNTLGYSPMATGLSLLAYTLPTLFLPPLAETLSRRYHPRVVIPLGLFIIGLGFILMKAGSSFADASWLTMLPGMVLAGVGLGLTTTPTTNTTTGAVSHERAGMASGMDISARLITLAINIAVMGAILVAGTFSYLKNIPFNSIASPSLYGIAEEIASGNTAQLRMKYPELALDTAGNIVHNALSQGFGWVMLYGCIGVWILAVISFRIFRSEKNDCQLTNYQC